MTRHGIEPRSHGPLANTLTARPIIIIIIIIIIIKRDKYLDLARELKKLWNIKVTIIPIVIGAFDTVTKGLLKGLEGLEVG